MNQVSAVSGAAHADARWSAECAGPVRTLDPYSVLVPLREGADGSPLFLMPHGGFTSRGYRSLARLLRPDQPVYCFEPVDSNGRVLVDVTVTEQADCYLKVLRGVQPCGPYYLGGLSGGGLIAWEIAARLRDSGDEVGLVVMFDTYARSCLPVRELPWRALSVFAWYVRYQVLLDVKKPKWYKMVRNRAGQFTNILERNTVAELLVKARGKLVAFFVGRPHRASVREVSAANDDADNRHIRKRYAQSLLEDRLGEAEQVATLLPGRFTWLDRLALGLLKRSFPFYARVYASSCSVAALRSLPAGHRLRAPRSGGIWRSYTPPPFDGNVLLFHASRQPPGTVDDPALGWREFARGRLDIIDVDGDHTSIVKSRFAADRLQEHLDRNRPEARNPAL